MSKNNIFDFDSDIELEYIIRCAGTLMTGGLHYGMFRSVVNHLGSKEQVDYYEPLIKEFRIQGCYAQTEIGHGSDVSSLETIADYDTVKDQFVVNSPTLTSGKFWPGELGKTATHAVFHAKLVINGRKYGVHAFIAQIRDLDTHRPLPGLEIGDIGPKGGYQAKDNGYMYFKNFRVSRSALLNKYVNVDRNGKFTSKGDPRFAYATMMITRIGIVEACYYNQLKALVIATRYSTLRTQFKTIDNGVVERKLIDYQSQKAALIPILAFAFSGKFMKHRLFNLYQEMMNRINKNQDFSLMKELHSICS